jgi:hypothetical protein
MESKSSELITVPRSRKLARHRRRLRHEQNIQNLGITTGNPPRTCAHVPKSSTAQTPRLRFLGRQDSRSGHRQQTTQNFTAFMTAVRRFMKTCAILWRKLHARFSEYAFDQANRVLDIPERISMKADCLSQVPNRQIERSTRQANLCASQRGRNAKQSNQEGSK